MSRNGGSRCVGCSQALLGGCPPSSSTEAPAPPLAPPPPAPVFAPASRPPPRFLARVSMWNLAQAGHAGGAGGGLCLVGDRAVQGQTEVYFRSAVMLALWILLFQ